MKIKIDSQIYIYDPSKEIKDFCKNNLIINNPEIAKKKAMNFSIHGLPEKIYMFSKNENCYILPLGTINDIWNIDNDIKDYDINFGKHDKLIFPIANIKLYDYQEKAINAMIKTKRGILESKCGSGKSIMAIEMIRRIGNKALIICQTKEILNQFKDYLINIFNLKDGEWGTIAEGKVEIGSLITIALRQTLVNIDLLQYKYEWGTIIVDECQNCAGSVTQITQYQKILNNLSSEYKYGLSATGYRVDGLTKCLYALVNTIKYRIDESQIKDKIIKAKIQTINTNYEIPESCQKYDGTILYGKLSTDIAENVERNELILKELQQNKDNYCLVLGDRLSGLQYLQSILGEGLLIDGKMVSKKAKKERELAVEKIRNKEEHYLFATYSLAREGLDIKSLNRLFLTAPTKNKITLIQSVGRVERQDTNKQTPIVYDFIDKGLYFEKAWKARKSIYKKNNNEIIKKENKNER